MKKHEQHCSRRYHNNVSDENSLEIQGRTICLVYIHPKDTCDKRQGYVDKCWLSQACGACCLFDIRLTAAYT